MGQVFFIAIRPWKAIAISVLAAFLLFVSSVHGVRLASVSVTLLSLQGKTIAVDPGHGGLDPGVVGRAGTLEKDVVFSISMRLAELLRGAGATVVLTRETDEESPEIHDLEHRTRIINSSGAQVALSIHANGFPSPVWYGAQVFYDTTGDPDSVRLARAIQDELIRVTRRTERDINCGIEHYILRHAKMPAATVEVGFLSNPEEESLLSTKGYQRKVAWAIFLGLARYFAEGPLPRR